MNPLALAEAQYWSVIVRLASIEQRVRRIVEKEVLPVMLHDQERMIGAILISNNAINILASVVTTTVVSRAIPGALGVAIATAVMTVLVVVLAEILPKTLAITRAEDVARFLSWPTYFVVRIFGPLRSCITATTRSETFAAARTRR